MSCYFSSGTKTSVEGDDNTAFSTKANAFIETFNEKLIEAGWTSSPRWAYLKITTTVDMFLTFSAGLELYFAVFPPAFDPGVSQDARLIIDVMPPGYVPPLGYVIHAVTGTNDREIIHQNVVEAFLILHVGSQEISGQDPAELNPHTFIQFTGHVEPGGSHPTAGLALNTGTTEWANGGYALTTQENGGHLSIFIGRDNTGGIDAFKPYVFICRDVAEQPIYLHMESDTDKTIDVSIPFTYSDWEMFAWETGVIFTQINHLGGHIELSLLNRPTGVTEALFGTADSSSSLNTQWRQTRRTAGFQYIAVEGSELFTQANDRHCPLLCSMYGDGQDNEWENGLSAITEAWVSMSDEVNKEAPIVGKLPYGIILNGSFSVDTPIFKWNEKTYHIVTRNAARDSAGKVTTLAMNVTNESASDPDCV